MEYNLQMKAVQGFLIILILFLNCSELKVDWIYDFSPAGPGDYQIEEVNGLLKNFYITGSYSATRRAPVAIISAISGNGKLNWFRLYENRNFKSSGGLSVIGAKDYSIIGKTAIYSLIKGISPGDSQYLIIARYDSLGNKEWEDIVELSPLKLEGKILLDHQGNLSVSGLKRANGAGDTVFIAQYLPSGKRVWLRKFPFKGFSVVNTKCAVLNGEYVVGGVLSELKDLFLLYFDSFGQSIKLVEHKSESEESLLSDLQTDKSGNIYLTGISRDEDGDLDWLTISYDVEKNLRWARYYGRKDSHGDVPRAVFIDESLRVYTVGSSQDSSGLKCVAAVKYDREGNKTWEKIFTGDREISIEPYFLNTDFFSSKKAGGLDYLFLTCLTDKGIVLLKFNIDGNFYQCGQYRFSGKENRLKTGCGLVVVVEEMIAGQKRSKLIKFGRLEILGLTRWD